MKSVSATLNKFGECVIYYDIKNNGAIIKNEITDSSLRDASRTAYEFIEPKNTLY
ncbi:MAG: hypothetical protein MJ225_01875 [Bacilli bacterium]|nr:hypothetical protein [Bacilli bacterium]